MPTNQGLLKENEVLVALNGNKIKNLNSNLRLLVKNLYGVIDEEKTLQCHKVDDCNKTDLVITYDDVDRCVSMKSGNATIVHNEILDNFCKYLKDQGISDKTIEIIRLYHYGDGTTDGTGQIRLSSEVLNVEMKDMIRKANAELNYDMTFIKRTINRLMFKGANEENIEADSLYFGDREYGIVITQNQVMKHLTRRGFDFYDSLHIGPLLIRPDSRYVDKPIADERKRHRMVAYWPNLQADVRYISKHYDYDYNRVRY